ncbi:MAG: hypothetical protein Q9N02_10000, partial [Ghiorsea sp.]|nr:hypothetical protein [Ghiorsea sp.]
ALYTVFPNAEPNPRPTFWNIHAESPTTVLGLSINNTTLQQAIKILKAHPDIAMFTTQKKKGAAEPDMHLEAYFDDVFDDGDRIILGLDANLDLLHHIKKEAYHPEIFPNNVIRVGIQKRLIPDILQLPIRTITIVAKRSIMFEEFKAKYGEPDKLIDDGQGNAHFIYPTLGLDLIQPAGGEQVLQFVSPEVFKQELLEPLLKTQHKDR